MGRLVKWTFGFPLMFVIWLFLSFVMPRGSVNQRTAIVFNSISYVVFIIVVIIVTERFLKFPFKRMLNSESKFSFRNLLLGFAPMLAISVGTTFLWKAVKPEDFMFSLEAGWPLDFVLAFVLVVLAALLEELLCRAYIVYFVKDTIETRAKQSLIYCLASAIVFTIAHFQNPEVAGAQAIYSMVFYFIMGFALMFITLKTGGIEAALGIHIANNLTNAWFFTYKDAALITNAIFTHNNNIGPWMLVQAIVCVVASCLCVLAFSKKSKPI